jgi:hypothetical protein
MHSLWPQRQICAAVKLMGITYLDVSSILNSRSVRRQVDVERACFLMVPA